ncbi:MAG TPA: dihydrofolate reductase [Candidatus Paceibacterota bacterium]|nr:dihydrofolate reductase [Candidatus Paceibacterota bacterium]
MKTGIKMIISIIVAMDKRGVIGKDSKGLPWHLPADLKHFKEVTAGKPVIMGRVTFNTIGKPLPGRRNIVMTRDTDFSAQGVEVVNGVDEVLEKVRDAEEVMVIGGGSVYKQFLPLANRAYITRVEGEFEGNVYFPEVNWNEWTEITREHHKPDEENPYPYIFLTYEKKSLNSAFS